MKKVISLFLTVVMALSMFSCLSVMAGAATTDLVVDQEYTVASGTTKIFVPEESGYYKFASNGNGDPKISINCLAGDYSFDDENGYDFSGVVELEAGEEVSCYFYNYDGSDCVFTITKTVFPESISFSLAQPIEVMENTNGYWGSEEIWNEETEETECVEYYCYYTPSIYFEGNSITVSYADGTCDIYTCDGDNFINSSGESLAVESYNNQSYENRWLLGSDNYFTVRILYGNEVQVPVTIIENPYESIEFVPVEPIEIIEYTNGYWYSDEIWNEETEEYEEVEYYFYYLPGVYSNGNQIVVNYKDGTVDTYTCDGDYFTNSLGDKLSVECYGNQSYDDQWTLGSENYFSIEVFGKKIQVPVTIIENPYESIEFIPVEPIEIIEYTNGYWDSVEIWNEETEEYEEIEYYSYYCPDIYSYGNVITVNYKDGTVDTYTYDGDYFTNSLGEELSVECYINQSYDYQWSLGSDNYLYIVLTDSGKEIQVPVTIIESPYESIEFVPVEPIEVIEYTNGYWDSDEIWNDETEEYEEIEYYRYYCPDIYSYGNVITVNYKDGTVDTYTCDGDYFTNSLGEVLSVEWYISQTYNNQWTLGSDNYLYIELTDFGKTIQVPVTIIESPYESIEFVPAEPLSIKQYTGGSWSFKYNEETGEEESYYSYSCGFIWDDGNIINLINKDGSVETYTSNGMSFINSLGNEYLCIDIDYNSSSWDVGSDNVFTITAMGKSCDVNVTIVENTSVIHNSSFVAEKLTDTTCIITQVITSDNFNGVLDIPEEVDGYTVVGIEDGVLYDVWGLQELNLPSTFNMISERLFSDCYSLKTINVSEENEVFASVNGVLYNKALTEILYCPLAYTGDFIIKAGVTELSPEVIACLGKAGSVEVESGNTSFAFEDDILYNSDFTKIYKAFSTDADYVMKSTVTEIADYSFSGNDTIETVVFSSGVTAIAYEAFAGCSSLTSVELPEALVSIEKGAFTETALTDITLPSTTKTIGDLAFSDCHSLSEANLNEGLESLGSSVFFCSALEEIVLPNSLTSMGTHCFSYNEKLSDVIIGTGLTTIPKYTFWECYSLKNINIPENITVIGEYSFYCTGLTSISFHDKITAIDSAFIGCNGLTEVHVVDSIISMNHAFSGCENLTSAYVGSGVKSMESAFSVCENLETVELAEGISGSCDYAFAGCSKLSEIDLPSTVTELSYMQFIGCEKVEAFDIPESLYKVEGHALDITGWYNNQTDGDVYLEHVLYNYKGTMPENYALTLKAGTKSIADSALESQINLVSVELPDGFKYIGDYAFDGCSGLTSVTIPGSVEYIGEYSLGYDYNNGINIVKYEDFIIYGVKNSVANTYADDNGFEFVAIAHTHTESDWIIDTDATCKVAGSKHKECTECGEVLETETIKAKGHTEVNDAAVAATCTKAGKTEGSHCSVCGEVIKAQTSIAAKGHTLGNWVIDVEATCTEKGSKHKECTVCGESLETETIPALGHTSSDWITDKKATVNAAGSKHKECTECGEVLETAVIPQLKTSTPKLTKVQNTASGVKVTWGAVDGADEYKIYRKTYNAKTKAWSGWSRIATGVTSTSYVDKNAKSGTYYRYTVIAANEAGNSAYDTTGLKTYFLSTPTVSATNSNSGVTVKWSKSAGATGYIVYRKTGTGNWQKIATVKGAGTLSYTDKKASAGVTYRYTIRAYYGSYTSSFVTNGFAVRRLTTPTLKSVTSAKAGITFKWNKVTGATGYTVYRKTGSGSWQKLATVKGNTTVSYLDKTAKKGVTYTYTVRAYYGTSTSYYNTKGLTVKDIY